MSAWERARFVRARACAAIILNTPYRARRVRAVRRSPPDKKTLSRARAAMTERSATPPPPSPPSPPPPSPLPPPPPPSRRRKTAGAPSLLAQFDALLVRDARVDCELALLENRAVAEVDAQMVRVRRALRFANIAA